MKTNSIPAIIMLVAGLIDCILSIYERMSLLDFTKRLLLVLIIFYVLGCIVKLILDINFPQMKENPEDTPEDSEDGEDAALDAEDLDSSNGRENISDESLENIEAGEDSV